MDKVKSRLLINAEKLWNNIIKILKGLPFSKWLREGGQNFLIVSFDLITQKLWNSLIIVSMAILQMN